MLKRFKKIAILVLILMMSINSFGAVVFGDDGANFITKEVFDNLKKGFDKQVDDYNTSLDGKVEGAIFEYLSGLKTKTIVIKSLLDADGKYGKFTEKWCSNTSSAYDTKDTKYFRHYWSLYRSEGRYSAGVTFDEPWFNSYATGLPAGDSVESADWDYDSSKLVEIVLDDLSRVPALSRMRYTSKMYTSVWEQSPLRTSSGTGSATDNTYQYVTQYLSKAVENTLGSIVQNKDNIPCYAGLEEVYDVTSYNWRSSRYIRRIYDRIVSGAITTSTKEVSYDYDKVNVNYPMSDASDYYWDASDNTSTPEHEGSEEIMNSTNLSNYTSAHSLRKGIWSSSYSLNWNDITPSVYTRYTTPWCCKSNIAACDEYLEHWNTVSSKNRRVKNGMYIGETAGPGDLYIKAKSDYAGKLYVYVGNDYIINWTDEDNYEGYKFDIGTDTTTCKLEEVPEESGIWIIFLPSAATEVVGGETRDVQATLKIEEMYEEAIR